MNQPKRLYRSRSERQIAGICGGLAEYFDLDPTIVRLAFVIVAIMGGPGLIVYFILAFILPEEPDPYLSEKRKRSDFADSFDDSDSD